MPAYPFGNSLSRQPLHALLPGGPVPHVQSVPGSEAGTAGGPRRERSAAPGPCNNPPADRPLPSSPAALVDPLAGHGKSATLNLRVPGLFGPHGDGLGAG